MPIEDYTQKTCTYFGNRRTIFQRGTGPHVVILPEVPGLHEQVFALGDRLVQNGFTVHLLSLFGKDGEPFRYRDAPSCLLRACIRKEFAVFAQHRSSPIANWVRSYCSSIYQRNQQGIGLIGMCLTGNFALSMLAEPWMLAPVLCQPSLPLFPPKALHVDPNIMERSSQNILAMRFSHDLLCPRQRFTALKKNLGKRVTLIEIDSSLGNPNNIPPIAHSVLTKDFVDQEGHPTQEALEQTIQFLKKHIKVS